MAFKTTVDFDGTPMDCLFAQYTLFRNYDDKGRVSSGVKGGTITMRVESTEKSEIIERMVNKQFNPFTGSITYKNTETDGDMRQVMFEDAYVTKFTETYDANNESVMSNLFTVTARSITIGNATHVNDWPGER